MRLLPVICTNRMYRTFMILIACALAVRFFHKLSGLIFLWWRKEYRLDRMWIHLKTTQGKSLYAGKTDCILAGIILLWFIPRTRVMADIGLALFAAVLSGVYLARFRSWSVVPRSPKVFTLYGAFGLLVILGISAGVPASMVLALLDVFMFPLSLLLVALLGFPTKLYHALIIRKAVSLLRAHAPMTVIGITGSYGKTSVKEYLATILSSRYRTLKTEASKNSPIGIAEVLCKRLDPSHEYFVVEMAAYKPGEIAEMARMVLPQIGILTAINPQHQDLFGTIEHTVKAKYELVAGLTGSRLLVANADDPRVFAMGQRAKREGCTVVWYSVAANGTPQLSRGERCIRASNIRTELTGIRFTCEYGKERYTVRAPVLGAHQAGNIIAAIGAAVVSGMPFVQAAKAAAGITPAHSVMEKIRGINGSTFINDTFNNNPDAAKAALSYIGSQKGTRFVVFQPMIELGAYAQSAHEAVGRHAAVNADDIILTNANYYPSFMRGVRSVSQRVRVAVMQPQQTAAYLKRKVTKRDIVLFKGKDAEHALKLLTP